MAELWGIIKALVQTLCIGHVLVTGHVCAECSCTSAVDTNALIVIERAVS